MPIAKRLPAAALLLAAGTLLLAAGVGQAEPALVDAAKPNPAAALCAQNGATVTIETAANGSRHGVCVFPNGSRIEEWAYFRNKHRLR